MSNLTRPFSQSYDLSAKVAQILQARTKRALDRSGERVRRAVGPQ